MADSLGQQPPICDYEGSNYQESFWDQGTRNYEDGAEAVALKRLMPPGGRLLLEVGAGAGRNTPRYKGFDRVVLMDYSVTQLQQALIRLGGGSRYIYVAADVYRLPFVDGLFDAATMIRVLHHMYDPQLALTNIRKTMENGATFILEYANKQNIKAILRYCFKRQAWNPFTLEPVEYIPLNYDFHPRAVRKWLENAQFSIQRILTVSHFRIQLLKRLLPTRLLIFLDSLMQPTGRFWQYTPSVFVSARAEGDQPAFPAKGFFCCPECRMPLPEPVDNIINCGCGLRWGIQDGIYNFKTPLTQ